MADIVTKSDSLSNSCWPSSISSDSYCVLVDLDVVLSEHKRDLDVSVGGDESIKSVGIDMIG